jgi:hypothetical protein
MDQHGSAQPAGVSTPWEVKVNAASRGVANRFRRDERITSRVSDSVRMIIRKAELGRLV